RIHLVERDYTKVYEKFIKVGSKVSEQIGAHGLSWPAEEEYDKLGRLLGKNKRTEDYHDLPSIESDSKAAEAILSLSSATNGSLAIKAWETLEKKSGQKDLTKLVIERAEEHITFNDITIQPRKVLSTPVFTGTETGN